MSRRIREHDWAATPLGPVERWPQSRRTAVDLMLASGHAMLLAWGPEKIILYNDAYAPMLGARHPEALGVALPAAWPDVWPSIQAWVERVFRGETLKFEDMPLTMTRHGYSEETWWNFSYSPVRDEAGEVAALLNVTADATAQHRLQEAQAALRASDERQRVLLDSQTFLLQLSDELRPVADPAVIKSVASRMLGERLGVNRAFYADAERGFWHVNRAYERDVIPLPDQPFSMATYGQWLVDEFLAGKAVIVDDLARDPRFDDVGRTAHLALEIASEVVVPLVKSGELVAILVVQAAAPRLWTPEEHALIEEVAQRTWAAVERARAENALLLADRRKDEFLAVLAHELRNGLAPLVYNVEILNRRLGDVKPLQEVVGSTGRQLQHLVHLVDDLLDVARITTGKIALELEDVKVRDVVSLAVDACHAACDRKHHRLSVVDEADADMAVRGDRVRLTQVIANLLSNAIKYTDDGGAIGIRIARAESQAVIEVSDNGIGIPPDALPQVFDLFTQVRNQQAYAAGGLGIGLALVKQLVEMHGGSVVARSDGPGKGSAFVVRLPITVTSAEAQPVPASAQPADMRRPVRVLVVDDNRDAADALALLLEMDGYDAQVAYGGLQALEAVRAQRPDLVLLDLGMPGMDGFETARRLRAELTEQCPRIVALTGWGQESDRLKTKAASFDGHLAKPPNHEDLQAVLAEVRASLH